MRDKNYQAIVNALELLANNKPAKSDGKITGVNMALEAGVSKATLYRYFNGHTDLREAYEAARKNRVRTVENAPETIRKATLPLSEEVQRLRSELAEAKREGERERKLKAHQIELLWLDNERLLDEVRRLQNHGRGGGNVVVLPD